MSHPDRAPQPRGLVLRDLRLTLSGRPLLAPIDADVGPGEVLALTGPSGCGKSSLLLGLAGVLSLPLRLTGLATLGGVDLAGLPAESRRLGLMFQDDLLLPHLDVAGNLLFGMPAGGTRRERLGRVDAALERAGLGGCASRRPEQLSGGQRQRVALLRALLSEPRALLLDEPFSRLDATLRASFRAWVWATLAERGLPALLVTHDLDDLPPGARRIDLQSAPEEGADHA
ncbi:ATP-binding cassette domain-containing protein [Leptothrix discophora]|uniref:ATP-binding cassette domain-containing protein n=1 Tax=Leptothrix discophora TaxID=89 RepID=A0ABT9FYE7_LEPDI|nr:ATP-binding cassette domain-containing protein [Leptothrix discophora]MDP4299259.1 ATP-binding cassette domain-containing protein [Leptothrix discophora]